jgi:hypothetical protein
VLRLLVGTKTNILQEGSAGFKAKVDVNKKEMQQGDVSFA